MEAFSAVKPPQRRAMQGRGAFYISYSHRYPRTADCGYTATALRGACGALFGNIYLTRLPGNQEILLKGLPVSEGVAHGRAFVLDAEDGGAIPVYRVSKARVPAEKERLRNAIDDAAAQLERIKNLTMEKIGPAHANIFMAQQMMVQDPMLLQQMFELIEAESLNAEAALDRTLDGYESLLAQVDDAYLSERASDIGEVRRRVLSSLSPAAGTVRETKLQELFDSDEPQIIVARELTPGETVGLDRERVLGFVTERGGQASHAAILARALGIPAVTGVPGIHLQVNHGQELLVNGNAGEVILWPAASTLAMTPVTRRKTRAGQTVVLPVEGLKVYANISHASEVDEVIRQEAEGVGLYRTELEFFLQDRLLSEEDQYVCYARVVEAMRGKPVYIRLLDFGADKHPHFLKLPKEENPCLGYRGARLLQNEETLFRTQARALARASVHGPIWVMYPMIVDVAQFVTLREMFRVHVEDIAHGEMFHGVMFEVPSACLEADLLFALADFGSIGSNDLIQYLFAVDRNNERVAYDYTPDRPVFWSLLGSLSAAAQAAGKPLSLCGEIGSKPEFIPRLMHMGITTVSVSPNLIGLARVTAQREHKLALARKS
jgi:phosphotransferase system enzyme I (PtsI)